MKSVWSALGLLLYLTIQWSTCEVAANKQRSPLDYLEVPKLREPRTFEINWIKQFVARHGRPKAEQVRQLLVEAAKVAGQAVMRRDNLQLMTPIEKDTYGVLKYHRLPELWDLLDTLGQPSQGLLCSTYGVELMREIFQTWGGIGRLAEARRPPARVMNDWQLNVFMEAYVRKHFRICLGRLQANRKVVKKMAKDVGAIEAKLDRLLLQKPAASSAEEQAKAALKQAMKVDSLATLDLERMLVVLGENHQDKKYSQKELVALVVDRLEEDCQQLRQQVGDTFDAYNMGRLISSKQAEEALSGLEPGDRLRFLKLNEYSRVCQQVCDPKRLTAVQRNLASSSSEQGWFKRIFS